MNLINTLLPLSNDRFFYTIYNVDKISCGMQKDYIISAESESQFKAYREAKLCRETGFSLCIRS